MSVHAKLAPSAAKYWVPCTASIDYIDAGLKEGKIPVDDSNVFSREGDEAHKWAAKVNEDEVLITDVPEEFRTHVAVFCNECERVFLDYPGSTHLYVEKQVPLFYSPKNSGTIDYALAGPEIGVHVIDFKYGKGVFVDAEENLQLAIYGNSVRCDIERKAKKDIFKDSLPVTLTIVQPRYLGAPAIRTWMTTIGDLKDFCLQIADSVLTIETRDLTRLKFSPSEDTCRFCPARHIPCVHKATAAVAAVAPRLGGDPLARLPDLTLPTLVDIAALTDEQLVSIKRSAPLLKQFLGDVEEVLMTKALATPEHLPEGLKWVRGREGNREWGDEAEAEAFLRRRLDEDEYKPRALISPTVAKGLLPTMPPPVKKKFEELIVRSPGKEVLALIEDKRDPITPGSLKAGKDMAALARLPDLEADSPSR